MIGRISMGNGFKGALEYDTKEGSELLATNCASTEPKAMAREMRIVANSNSHCKKPVLHTSLSLPKSDKLTNEQWQKVGQRYLELMKFEGHQFAITRHSDSKHDHIHICVNRVNLETGKAWSDSKSKYREMECLRKIEKEFGLTKVDKTFEAEKNGKFELLKNSIDNSLKTANGDFTKFKNDLEKSGVRTIENRSESTGRISGLSFQSERDKVFKGSQIGKGYSVNGLQARGLQINQSQNQHKNLEHQEPKIEASHNSTSALGQKATEPKTPSTSSTKTEGEVGNFCDFRDEIRANKVKQDAKNRAIGRNEKGR